MLDPSCCCSLVANEASALLLAKQGLNRKDGDMGGRYGGAAFYRLAD